MVCDHTPSCIHFAVSIANEYSAAQMYRTNATCRYSILICAWLAASCGGGSTTSDATTVDSSFDAGDQIVDDGVAMRRACTNNFGTALSTGYGRLDGFLVAVVDPGTGGCNADRDHIHLQVLANGKVYDVAVNTAGAADVLTATRPLALTGSPWQEGWHTGFSIDYTALGLRAADFAASTQAALLASLKAEFANVNHISVYAISYTDATGVHLVHRNGFGKDGVIVTQPLSRPAKWRMFRFSDQTF
jgi:hypothetical protein